MFGNVFTESASGGNGGIMAAKIDSLWFYVFGLWLPAQVPWLGFCCVAILSSSCPLFNISVFLTDCTEKDPWTSV